MKDEQREQGQTPLRDDRVIVIEALTQSVFALQAVAHATLTMLALCDELGVFDAVKIRDTANDLDRELNSVLHRVNRRSRAVFGKEEPAGTPPSTS